MRIVHALPFYDPATQFGGPIAQLRMACKALSQRGHTVHVVTSDLGIGPDMPRQQWVEKDGYQVWYSPVGRLGQFAPYYMPQVTQGLKQCLPEADVVHTHLGFTHLNTVVRKMCARYQIPYVYTPRSTLDPVRIKQKYLAKQVFLRLFERRVIRDAAAIHALTEVEKQQVMLQQASEAQIHIIPNCCELASLPDSDWPKGKLFKEHFDVSDDRPVILFLGRLQTIKGLDLLVQAFAQIRKHHPSALLVIAGPDEGAKSIAMDQISQTGCGDAVKLVGKLDGQLKLAALKAADIFALTSHSEGIPNAVLEAMSAGIPCVVTEPCNVPEVAQYQAGFVTTLDVKQIATAMDQLLSDTNLRNQMGQQAKSYAQAHLHVNELMGHLESMYQSLSPATSHHKEPS
ncbi:MAG: glycosyltransferase [Phycisphaeraceae bacterium JB051]